MYGCYCWLMPLYLLGDNKYSACAATEEISTAVCDDDPDRLELARLYNEVKP